MQCVRPHGNRGVGRARVLAQVVAGSGEGTDVSFETDLYMLGGLLYELLTSGIPPFHWYDRAERLVLPLFALYQRVWCKGQRVARLRLGG